MALKRDDRMEKNCLTCGKIIRKIKPSHFEKTKFCSRSCVGKTLIGDKNPYWKGGDLKIICGFCQKSFFVCKAISFRAKYCSTKCRACGTKGQNSPIWKGGYYAAQYRHSEKKKAKRNFGKPPRIPTKKIIRKKRILPPVTNVMCVCIDCKTSRLIKKIKRDAPPKRCIECELKNKKGKNNPRWKGGITPLNARLRRTPEYIQWRIDVFKRDNYTCVWCGQIGGKLHADHIKAFSKYPDLRTVLSNGRTLCIECHKKTPSYLSGALRKDCHV